VSEWENAYASGRGAIFLGAPTATRHFLRTGGRKKREGVQEKGIRE